MEVLCRICLDRVPQTCRVPLSYVIKANKTVCQVIKECALIQICEEDTLPKHVCSKCFQQLRVMHDFRELIICSDNQLREKVPSDTNSICNSTEHDFKPQFAFVDFKELANSHNNQNQEILNARKNQQLPANRNAKCNNEDSQRCSEVGQIDQTIRTIAGRKPSKVSKVKRKVHEFTCDICKKVLTGRSNRLEQHIIMAHSDIKNFPCELCDKKFKSKQQLVNHFRVHTGEKPYECDMCNATFTSSQSLFNHKKKHTGKHKSYKCTLCEKGYATPGELETHERIVHTGEKPFLCEICSRAYSSVRNLGLHKRSVHEKTEKCPKCSLMLSTRRIKQHLQKHQDKEQGIRRYTCDQCGKSFYTQHVLKRHQVLHLGHKPYTCEICHKAFSQKYAVETHMRAHSDIRGYCCQLCAKTFKYKQHLRLHVQKNHRNGEDVLLV